MRSRPLLTITAAYAAATIVMTWPVAAGMARDLPGDLGDPAFVAGVIAWGSKQWLAFLGGDLDALARFWNAPIFYPEPLTTAYSEHFALHALLTLPVYALTRNPMLCYNIAFLATFVAGAVGMYLLVRELTDFRSPYSAAAFVAGLAFAFAPYRIGSMAHLQVLSAQWMPFVLLGLHRYFRSGSSDGLTGAAAALWAQNLSSGYYMLYFGPFVGLFVGVELLATGAWRHWRTWVQLAMTAAVTLVATLPFALPYLERTRGSGRGLAEIIWFSADVKAFVTASPLMNVWGHLQTLPKAEGFLFPGLTVVALASFGTIVGWRRARVAAAFGALALVTSVWLSLGPQIQFGTQPTGAPSLYRVLWEYVPGFDAARVPARFATITALSLALLTGVALTWFDRGRRQWVIAVCGLLILVEGSAMPVPINGTWTSAPGQIFPPPARLYRLEDAPEAFRYLSRLDHTAVVVHFPFGLPEREIQYGYYAMLHGRHIVNGYSGAFPATYSTRLAVLANPFADPPSVQAILDGDRVTHAIVHAGAYTDARGTAVVELLEKLDWKRVAQFGEDYVLTK